MTTTLTLPTGTKYRAASARRYVVVTEAAAGRPVTVYRTDDVDRAIKALSHHKSAVVVDTVDRKVRVGSAFRTNSAAWVPA